MQAVTIIAILASLVPYVASARWTRNDTCPTEIKTTIPNSRLEFGSMVSVHEALSQCPNITSLDLRVTLLGCSEWPDRWNFPFNYNGGDSYPSLKKLRLDGYDFSSSDDIRPPWQMPLQGMSNAEAWTFGLYDWIRRGYWKPWLRAQIYGYPPTPPSKSNLDLWLGAMNWSAIEELAIADCSDEFVEKVPSHLRSLRWLASTNISFVEALPNNTLESLTWVGPHKRGDFDSILERQGAKLQELEFRDDEMGYSFMRRKFNMSIIPETAKYLKHLSVNIPRNGSWPLESFRAIAQLSQLQSLVIYSNLQSECQRQMPDKYTREWSKWRMDHGDSYCIKEDRYQKPLLDEGNAEELYKFIKEANVGSGPENVTFRIGDWTPIWDGPLYSPPWIEGRKVEIHCSNVAQIKAEKHCEMVRSYGYWPPESNTKGASNWMFEGDSWDFGEEGDYDYAHPHMQ
ncbi:hypothetical protein SVAN01_00652 [Stagonosporopsis vannaccii]|nr:hypothetical protein SVAN01_00652 [Stagonosporopsis vannaccii]